MKVRSAARQFVWGVLVCFSIVMFLFGVILILAATNNPFKFFGGVMVVFSLLTWASHWLKQEQFLVIDGEEIFISVKITEEAFETLSSIEAAQKLPIKLAELGIVGGFEVNWSRRVIYFFTKSAPPEDPK